jgi:hypothetical protein
MAYRPQATYRSLCMAEDAGRGQVKALQLLPSF